MKSQHQRVDAFVHGRRRRRCFSSSWAARATARFRQSGVAHDEHKRRLFFIYGEKNSNFFFCSLSRLGFLSKKRLSKFEPRFSRRKTFSTAESAQFNHTTYKTPVFAKRKRTPRCRFRVRIYYSRRRLRAEERSTRPPRRRHTKAKPPSRCALPTMVRTSS